MAHLEVLARQLDVSTDVKLTCYKLDTSCSTTSHSLLQFVELAEFVCAQKPHEVSRLGLPVFLLFYLFRA